MAGPALCLPLFICPPPISAPPSYRLHFSLLYPSHHITSGPACHCGRSRLPSPFPTPYHPFSLLILFLSPSPTYIPLGLHSGPACHCGRSRHIILSRFISHTSFLALPPTNINLQAYSTSPPSSRPGLPLWLVSPFPITYSFPLLYPHTSSSPIVTWPGLSLR